MSALCWLEIAITSCGKDFINQTTVNCSTWFTLIFDHKIPGIFKKISKVVRTSFQDLACNFLLW